MLSQQIYCAKTSFIGINYSGTGSWMTCDFSLFPSAAPTALELSS